MLTTFIVFNVFFWTLLLFAWIVSHAARIGAALLCLMAAIAFDSVRDASQ